MKFSEMIEKVVAGEDPKDVIAEDKYDEGFQIGLKYITDGKTKEECLKDNDKDYKEGIEAAYA